ncbi:MAG: hypothetical protein ACFFAO_02110 [Candidatus Hermodarchaeota archaeon]
MSLKNKMSKKEWCNTEKFNWLIDLTGKMYGGAIFDNRIIFIDFGPEPPKPTIPIYDANDFFLCSGYCHFCDNYECKMGGI